LKLSFDGDNEHISILSDTKGEIKVYSVDGRKIVESSIDAGTKR